MQPDARIEADAFNDLARVHAGGHGIAVQLVEEGDAHGEIGVGEQLDGFGFGRIGEQHRHVLFGRAFQHQIGKLPPAQAGVAHDDARWVEIVVQRPAFAQEFRREKHIVAAQIAAQTGDETHRDGGFHHHRRRRIGRQHSARHIFHRRRVEMIGVGIVIGRGGDHHQFGIAGGGGQIGRRRQLQRLVGEEILQLGIDDRALAVVDQIDPRRAHVHRRNVMVLRQQHGVRQADIAQTDNGNLHDLLHCTGSNTPPIWRVARGLAMAVRVSVVAGRLVQPSGMFGRLLCFAPFGQHRRGNCL